jgi:hypothetical protein
VSESVFTCRRASTSRNSRRYTVLTRFPFMLMDSPNGELT